MKRYQILKHYLDAYDNDCTVHVAEFDFLWQAEDFLERVCDDYTRGQDHGWWYLELSTAPILLEIVDWSNQLDPMAVC